MHPKQSQTASKASSLKIVSWNPNTLGGENSLTWLFGSLHGHSPNIICIQETLLTSDKAKTFKMQGFQTFHTPATSASPRIGENRGLITLVSLDLLVDTKHPLNFFKMGPDTETLSVRVQSSDGWQIVNNVYTHQGARPQNLILDPQA